jgi:hypothetical protein
VRVPSQVRPEEREHIGIELLVEGDAVAARRIGADLSHVLLRFARRQAERTRSSRPGGQTNKKAKCVEFGTTWYSCFAGRFLSTAATLSAEGIGIPHSSVGRSDAHS